MILAQGHQVRRDLSLRYDRHIVRMPPCVLLALHALNSGREMQSFELEDELNFMSWSTFECFWEEIDRFFCSVQESYMRPTEHNRLPVPILFAKPIAR